KPEIANLRGIDARVIDLVDDAETECEPQPCRPQRGADHILGAAGPAGRYPGRAGGVFEGSFGLCDRHDADRSAICLIQADGLPQAPSPGRSQSGSCLSSNFGFPWICRASSILSRTA